MGNNMSRMNIDGDFLGEGNWEEMLCAFHDGIASTDDDMKIMYVAKFGVFKDPKNWGRMLGSLVRTLAKGEAKTKGLSNIHEERLEAEIVDGFNEVLIGTNTSVTIKKHREYLLEEPPANREDETNWDPRKLDWPKEDDDK